MKKTYCLFLSLFVLVAMPQNAIAQDSLYNVEVYVDVTADSAAEAKEQAMTQANRTAFNTVARKITTDETFPMLSELSDDQILNFVKEVSIKSEKSSNVRYMANLKVAINDDLLKQYMAEKNITPAILTASDILIIPTFREFKTDTPMLWEADNIWRKAWEEEAGEADIVKFSSIVPNGSNYASLDVKKALNLNKSAMEQVAFNNNTSDIFVADAVYNGIEGLTVNILSYQDGGTEVVEIYGERSPQLLLNAISEVKKAIINKLKNQSIIENTQKNKIVAIYDYQSMSEWVKVEKSLREIGGINDIKIIAMTSGKVQFEVDYTGSFSKFERKLQSNNFSLVENGEIFFLKKQ
ncbi:MAG: hypothetical protein PHE89_00440 [Alphaproteobacteria bacterium]|nr:hypothetical protein [Alphaproteobacteria bacterium]